MPQGNNTFSEWGVCYLDRQYPLIIVVRLASWKLDRLWIPESLSKFNLLLTIEVLIIFLCRKNVSVEGVPASGSHLRLGVYVLPGNTKEKAQIFSGFHQPDIINPNWCFALSNVFRTDLFNTFHNQRNRIKSCCEVFIETLYKNNCQVDLGVF